MRLDLIDNMNFKGQIIFDVNYELNNKNMESPRRSV